MYGQTARQAILKVLKEAPELTKEAEKRTAKDARMRSLTDRLLSELWTMGFAVSARTPRDRGPRKAEKTGPSLRELV